MASDAADVGLVDLSTDLLLQIALLLPPKDLCAFASTCKRLQGLARDARYWCCACKQQQQQQHRRRQSLSNAYIQQPYVGGVDWRDEYCWMTARLRIQPIAAPDGATVFGLDTLGLSLAPGLRSSCGVFTISVEASSQTVCVSEQGKSGSIRLGRVPNPPTALLALDRGASLPLAVLGFANGDIALIPGPGVCANVLRPVLSLSAIGDMLFVGGRMKAILAYRLDELLQGQVRPLVTHTHTECVSCLVPVAGGARLLAAGTRRGLGSLTCYTVLSRHLTEVWMASTPCRITALMARGPQQLVLACADGTMRWMLVASGAVTRSCRVPFMVDQIYSGATSAHEWPPQLRLLAEGTLWSLQPTRGPIDVEDVVSTCHNNQRETISATAAERNDELVRVAMTRRVYEASAQYVF